MFWSEFECARNTLAKDPILFVGSSSMVFWETENSFPEYPIINRGFGGASLPEVMHYYDDVIKKHNPSMILLYCDIHVEPSSADLQNLQLTRLKN